MKKLFIISTVALLLAVSCQKQEGKKNDNNTKQATSTSENNLPQGNKTGWNTYTNAEWKFEIKYPGSFKVYTEADVIRELGYIPPCDSMGLVCLFYSLENHPKTNFTGAGVSVSPLENHSFSESQCRSAYEGEQKIGEQTINNLLFTVFKGSSAGMSHWEERKTYRTFHNSVCMGVTLRVTYNDMGAYESGAVQEFNQSEVWDKLEQALSTFKFTESVSVWPLKKTKEEGVYVYYQGIVTLSGTYSLSNEGAFTGGLLCFYVDEKTSKLVPREAGDSRNPWFCFKDQAAARSNLGIPKSCLNTRGSATLTIKDYVANLLEGEAWDTANISSVVSSEKPVCS